MITGPKEQCPIKAMFNSMSTNASSLSCWISGSRVCLIYVQSLISLHVRRRYTVVNSARQLDFQALPSRCLHCSLVRPMRYQLRITYETFSHYDRYIIRLSGMSHVSL